MEEQHEQEAAAEDFNPTEWITTEEAAELSEYHPVYIRSLARDGKIHAEKRSGRDWWIDRSSLEEYVGRMKRLGSAKHNPRGVEG